MSFLTMVLKIYQLTEHVRELPQVRLAWDVRHAAEAPPGLGLVPHAVTLAVHEVLAQLRRRRRIAAVRALEAAGVPHADEPGGLQRIVEVARHAVEEKTHRSWIALEPCIVH